jgi:hypothetical protein
MFMLHVHSSSPWPCMYMLHIHAAWMSMLHVQAACSCFESALCVHAAWNAALHGHEHENERINEKKIKNEHRHGINHNNENKHKSEQGHRHIHGHRYGHVHQAWTWTSECWESMYCMVTESQIRKFCFIKKFLHNYMYNTHCGWWNFSSGLLAV